MGHGRSQIRVAIVGAGGTIGSAAAEQARAAGLKVAAFRHSDVDIAEAKRVDATLDDIRPHVVINAAAYTAVDRAELEPEVAYATNVLGPANLATTCARHRAWLIHLSTDCVFGDGTSHPQVHFEDSQPTPMSVYGHTKHAGEAAVRSRLATHMILRLAWIFGSTGRSFVDTVTRRALVQDEIRIASDQVGCPTPLENVASSLVHCVQGLSTESYPPGTYHFCSREPVSRLEFARLVVSHLSQLTKPRVQSLIPVPSADLDRASRPRSAILDCKKFTTVTGIQRPEWRPVLQPVVQQLWHRYRAESV